MDREYQNLRRKFSKAFGRLYIDKSRLRTDNSYGLGAPLYKVRWDVYEVSEKCSVKMRKRLLAARWPLKAYGSSRCDAFNNLNQYIQNFGEYVVATRPFGWLEEKNEKPIIIRSFKGLRLVEEFPYEGNDERLRVIMRRIDPIDNEMNTDHYPAIRKY